MKNRKIFLLILVAFLFSGCTVKYNLYINNDLSVNEQVVAFESTSELNMNTKQEPKVAANSLFNLYKKKGIDYSFSTVEENGGVTSTVSTSFNSLEEYENYFESDIVKEVNITKKDGYITLEYEQNEPLTDDYSESLIYDSIEVRINIPFMVTETNADRVQGDTYIWTIEKNNNLKNINITFNSNETKNSKKFNFGIFEINIKYSILIILGFAVVVFSIVLFVYLNNKKNNKV